MLQIISPRLIIRDHFRTFRNPQTSKTLWLDAGFLWGAPLLAAAAIYELHWRMSGVANLLSALSLLAGLLFNLLVLMFDVARKAATSAAGQSPQNFKLLLTQQLQANVTYALFVALITVLFLGVESARNRDSMHSFASALLAYLLIHFFLCLMMILKRIKSVFDNEFR